MTNQKEGEGKAPTVVIETVSIVRPIKILSLLCGALAVLLLALSIAATAWIYADGAREGLWERCVYTRNVTNSVDCQEAQSRDWVMVCQALCLTSILVCILAIVVTSVGLRSVEAKSKYWLYWAAIVLYLLSDAMEVIGLVVFPIKFLDEIHDRKEKHWSFGWAYIIGWVGVLFSFVAGLLLVIDKGSDEIIYKEKIVQEENKNGVDPSKELNEATTIV